jgi:hypothetical protein
MDEARSGRESQARERCEAILIRQTNIYTNRPSSYNYAPATLSADFTDATDIKSLYPCHPCDPWLSIEGWAIGITRLQGDAEIAEEDIGRKISARFGL